MKRLEPTRWLLLGFVGVLLLSCAPEAEAQKKVKPGTVAPGTEATQPATGQPNPGPQNTRMIARLGTDQLRHGSRILCLTFKPDGQMLAAGGGSDPVRVWDTGSGQ